MKSKNQVFFPNLTDFGRISFRFISILPEYEREKGSHYRHVFSCLRNRPKSCRPPAPDVLLTHTTFTIKKTTVKVVLLIGGGGGDRVAFGHPWPSRQTDILSATRFRRASHPHHLHN